MNGQGENEDVLAVFQRDGKPWKEERADSQQGPPGAGKELTFVMNIHLRKRTETNITNNRGPTPILFYFSIMATAGVDKLFLSGPESKGFRPCGPRGQIEAITWF